MTHATLVALGEKWARTRASVVLTEMTTYAGEIPDVVAFGGGWSIVIECKVSRSDFLRDKHKVHRRDETLGMGNRRFFLAPVGVIRPEELPPKWGLLTAKANHVALVQESGGFIRRNTHAEIIFLTSMLRRAQLRLGSRRLSEWLRMENRFEAKTGLPPNAHIARAQSKKTMKAELERYANGKGGAP